MAKSNIIKQLANDEISLEVALDRLLIIASDIGNDKLAEWAEHELTGYPKEVILPEYRKLTYDNIKCYYNGIFISDNSLFSSNGNDFSDTQQFVKNYKDTQIRLGINSLKSILVEKTDMQINHSKFNTSTNQEDNIFIEKNISYHKLNDMITKIKTIIIKTLLKLEKEFGNLDSLDIDTSSKTKEEQEAINATVINYIYNDNSITIGNDNNIKNSDILTGGDNNEQE